MGRVRLRSAVERKVETDAWYVSFYFRVGNQTDMGVFCFTLTGMTENFDVAAAISLTDEESQSTAAHYAAQSGAYATLRLLATYHAPIVKKGNYNGETPLHHAAANGQEEVSSFFNSRMGNWCDVVFCFQCIRVLTDELGCERTVSDKSG